MSLLAHHHARLTAQPRLPLVKQFIHDSRQDFIKYGPGWSLVGTGGGSPYRNEDVAVSPPQPADIYLDFSFTSQGQPDEWVKAYCPIDGNCHYRIYQQNVLLAEGLPSSYNDIYTPRLSFENGSFYPPGTDIYDLSWFTFKPAYGVNKLRIVKVGQPANTDNAYIYFDGWGLNLRGGPLPI